MHCWADAWQNISLNDIRHGVYWVTTIYINPHMYWLKKTEKNGNENNTWQAKVITELTLWEFEVELHSSPPMSCMATGHTVRGPQLSIISVQLTSRQQRHEDCGRAMRHSWVMPAGCVIINHHQSWNQKFFSPRYEYSWLDDRHICCTPVPMNGLANPPTEVLWTDRNTESRCTNLKTRILRLNRETKLTKTVQFIMIFRTTKYWGYKHLRPPPQVFRGPSLSFA